jgi:hypothetical protein
VVGALTTRPLQVEQAVSELISLRRYITTWMDAYEQGGLQPPAFSCMLLLDTPSLLRGL